MTIVATSSDFNRLTVHSCLVIIWTGSLACSRKKDKRGCPLPAIPARRYPASPTSATRAEVTCSGSG